MALPKLQTSEYTLTLPSTQEEIKFRPFLVREQKILMIAQESGEEKEISAAMSTMVSNCTFGVLDSNTYPMFDIEYVFLQLRSKSAGSKVKLSVLCPDDNETMVLVEVDLEKIDVQMTLEHTQEIAITEDIKVNLRYPRLKDLNNLGDLGYGDFEQAMELIHECVESVVSGEDTIHRVDMTKGEIVEFIDSFNIEQLEKLMKFFETMPKLRHVINVVNPNTKVKGEVLLEGLESFLE
tara:strand:- start:227 stop:937 length:711 start_codon:yes stop_codon:yes gene_type:complete